MKKVIVLILAVIAGCFIADRIGSNVCSAIHEHSDGITAFKYRYLFSKCEDEMVLMGTSRCEAHYVSTIIQDSLNLSVYNGGIDASGNIYSHYAALCLLLRHCQQSHHTPRYIGLELSVYDFAQMPDPFNTLTYLAPYIGYDEDVDEIFRKAGTYWKYQLSHLYRYNAKIMADLAGYAVPYGKSAENGYLKKDKPSVAPETIGTMPSTYIIDTLKVHYLNAFAKKCKDNGIFLFCMISPSYDKAETTTYSFLHDWAKENNLWLFDYHTKGFFSNSPELFYDNRHLWNEGAVKYTNIFVRDLKEKMQKNLK